MAIDQSNLNLSESDKIDKNKKISHKLFALKNETFPLRGIYYFTKEQPDKNMSYFQQLNNIIIKNCAFRMATIQKNFDKSFRLYELKGPFLPPKILWKLDLILYMIQGNILNKDLLSIQQQMQFEDLEDLDVHSLKLVFNNIIDTLFSKQSVENTKCQLRKKGIFSSWIYADILHDTKSFLINYSHKTYTFEKAICEIKKSKQSKRSLELYFKRSHKYTLKFENEDQMRSVWQSWQKQIIDTKTQKNYEQMKTLMYLQNTSTFMQKISLFGHPRTQMSLQTEKVSFSPQTLPHKQFATEIKMNKSLNESSPPKKRFQQAQLIHLKPVPHGYVSKMKNERSIIAIGKNEQAKIYIEYVFCGKFHQKHLLSLLLLQKSWNSQIVLQSVQKSENSPSQIYITRKFDSFKQLEGFSQVKLKATYTPWNSKMSMIIIQSTTDPSQSPSLHSKSVITLQAEGNNVRILIQDELSSSKYSSEKLKKVLLEMYREIIKLDLIQEKIVFKDFEAETLITNMLEDQQSTNTESLDDLESTHPMNSDDSKQDSSNDLKQMQSKKTSSLQQLRRLPDSKILRLNSPLEYPNPEYIRSVKHKEFEKNYFKYYFPQENLEKYDDYVPHYKMSKLIQSKIYEITQSRDLRFIDQQLLDSQKETLRFVLRQIGANLISGKSVLNVSLPVDIFESQSGLQRGTTSLSCCPDYLLHIAHSPPLEQIQSVIGFAFNVVACELEMQKPFNPILGETFQGYIKGIPVYYEQTSHNPPISSYFMKCPEFTIYGNLIPFVDVSLNTGIGGNLSQMNVVLANGSHFQCYFPPSEIAGLIYGDRKFRCYNRGLVFEKNLRLYAEISIQNQKKGIYETPVKLRGGQIVGGIYKVKPEFIDEIQRYKKQHKNLKKFGGLTKDNIVEKYHSISGQWFANIMVDSKIINENKNVYPVEYAKNVLPSDSNFRLDVLYHKMKDLSHSQKEKEILEILQRADKKLRQKYGPSSH